MEETKDNTDELFDKAEFISPAATPTEDEGFVEEKVENAEQLLDDKSTTVKEDKENVFEKKPILMVNVENVVDEKYTQDQELKVLYIFIFNF